MYEQNGNGRWVRILAVPGTKHSGLCTTVDCLRVSARVRTGKTREGLDVEDE